VSGWNCIVQPVAIPCLSVPEEHLSSFFLKEGELAISKVGANS
jgi:hypothetical protein